MCLPWKSVSWLPGVKDIWSGVEFFNQYDLQTEELFCNALPFESLPMEGLQVFAVLDILGFQNGATAPKEFGTVGVVTHQYYLLSLSGLPRHVCHAQCCCYMCDLYWLA